MSQHQSQQVPQKFKTSNSKILVRVHQAATPAQGWRSISSSYGFRRGWSRSEATRRSQSLRSRSQSQASARRLTAGRQTVPCSAVSGENIRSDGFDFWSLDVHLLKYFSNFSKPMDWTLQCRQRVITSAAAWMLRAANYAGDWWSCLMWILVR